jgi:hypothetical protein
MHWRIWAKYGVLFIFAAVWIYALGGYASASFRILNSKGSAIFVVGFLTLPLLLIFYAFFSGHIADHSLLKRGKCVVGSVISQRRIRKGRGGSRSEICYSFPVGPGKPMTGRGTDWTRYYAKDMPVLVFYDPEDISKHVAYCCTDWIVRLEDGTFLEP